MFLERCRGAIAEKIRTKWWSEEVETVVIRVADAPRLGGRVEARPW